MIAWQDSTVVASYAAPNRKFSILSGTQEKPYYRLLVEIKQGRGWRVLYEGAYENLGDAKAYADVMEATISSLVRPRAARKKKGAS